MVLDENVGSALVIQGYLLIVRDVFKTHPVDILMGTSTLYP
jgi:hypothetical protein